MVITKSAREDDKLRGSIEAEDAAVLNIPLIEVSAAYNKEDSLEFFKGIATYDWIVFSSVNGVHYFFEAFFNAFSDIRAFGPARIACVGNQTAQEVGKYFLEVDLVPEKHTAADMIDALVETGSLASGYVLYVTGSKINKQAIEALEGEGEAIVDTFIVYESKPTDLAGNPVATDFREKGADIVMFASPSAAESFLAQAKDLKLKPNAQTPKTLSIGPVTSAAMRKLKLPVDGEAVSPKPEDVVQAMVDLCGD